jgi:hypothetical protein
MSNCVLIIPVRCLIADRINDNIIWKTANMKIECRFCNRNRNENMGENGSQGGESDLLSSVVSETSMRHWGHTWVILIVPSQNNNHHHTRCR